jgi:hypothetical protein
MFGQSHGKTRTTLMVCVCKRRGGQQLSHAADVGAVATTAYGGTSDCGRWLGRIRLDRIPVGMGNQGLPETWAVDGANYCYRRRGELLHRSLKEGTTA